MNQYKDYTLEDFVLDARFQNWVRFNRLADKEFWVKYIHENPEQADDITNARALLESVYSHYQTEIDESEIDIEIHELLDRVRAAKSDEESRLSPVSWQNSFFNKKTIFLVAAVVLLTVGIAWLTQCNCLVPSEYSRQTSSKLLFEEVNETSSNKVIVLSDGSKVILHPHARLSFAKTFPSDSREVYLSGDAHFFVSKDAKRPFLVYANELVTKVLGTTFAVKAPNDMDQKTTVEVTEGKVSVFRQSDFLEIKNPKDLQSKGMVLLANQKVVFEPNNSNMLKTLRDSPEVVPSAENPKTFDFVNVPASVVLDDLKEAYQVDIIFDKELLYDCPVTASLSRQSLFEKLDIICEVIEARYEMLDGKIVVYSKGCKV